MGRIDYVRVGMVYRTDEPLGVQHVGVALKVWEAEIGEGLSSSNAHSETVWLRGGGTMRVFEAWGPNCNFLFRPGSFIDMYIHELKLLRVDYRQELSSDANFDLISATINPKTRQNVHRFNSRVREKKGDRDAGGIGFGIGSHKGDNRLTVYRRGNEQPAVELQLRTRQLQPLKDALYAKQRMVKAGHSPAVSPNYAEETTLDFMVAALDKSAGKVFALSLGQLVNGDWELSGNRLDAHAEFVRRQMSLMPPSWQQATFLGALADQMADAAKGSRVVQAMEPEA